MQTYIDNVVYTESLIRTELVANPLASVLYFDKGYVNVLSMLIVY